MKKTDSPIVLFNASVILAGLRSPRGGSAKLLSWCKKRIITGVISEVILDEVLNNAHKISLEKDEVRLQIKRVFGSIGEAPQKQSVEIYRKIVVDPGDAHILASCQQRQVDFLVTLDKKHLLILKDKVSGIKLVSPAELIEKLSKNS